jgi:serine protease Do
MVPGVIVVTVDRDSPAARKGIQPGDIITAIDQQPVASPEQFRKAIGKSDPKKGVIVVLLSGRTSRFEVLKEGAE